MGKEANKRCILTLPSNRMEIKLHFLPEKPTESCKVIVFKTLSDGELWAVDSTTYSKYWDMFHMTDEREELRKCVKETNDIIIAWSYFEETAEGLKDEIQ